MEILICGSSFPVKVVKIKDYLLYFLGFMSARFMALWPLMTI